MTDLMWDMAHPVGTIRQFYSGFDPNDVRGTWEKIEGRFLLASSSSYARGSTGGEKTHVLTIDEMPSHKHDYLVYDASGGSVGTSYGHIPAYESATMRGWSSNVGATGGNKAHNNMPPYLAVDTWRRVA